ncbi:M20/M25/M40 family metallo-hydrolase [Embleya sp. MST-111070]|uniref:M20/M25/M40 family metallo-hydrolase n=1 Tax=Embleya sp. MST-111070 TaxID=3398231 RepID=UPI003F7321FF
MGTAAPSSPDIPSASGATRDGARGAPNHPRDRHAHPEPIAFRRDLCMRAEPDFEEARAAEKLVERLREAGLAPRVRTRGTALVRDIAPTTASAAARRTVALRADVDALPVHGRARPVPLDRGWHRAHACGHDVHTTALPAAALAPARFREQDQLTRAVRPVFRGDRGGAARWCVGRHAGRVLGGGEVESVRVPHRDPTKQVGRIGAMGGAVASGTDTFHFHPGAGGLGARPHPTANVPAALIRMANALLATPGRFAPRTGVVITAPVIHTGHARHHRPAR